MRNIWPMIVGAVVVAGAGVTLYNATGGKEPASTPPAVAIPTPTPTQETATAPTPAATFSKVEISPDDFILGKPDAPVTIVEYASLTCPHCANFHNVVLPTIQKDYIDKGLVRLIYRDFPLDNLALTAAVVSRCAGRDRYFSFIGAFYKSQDKWARDSNPMAAISRIARLGGMSQAEFNACLENQPLIDKVLEQRLDADKTFGVNSTPTLIINGEKYRGRLSLPQFRAVVTPKLK